MGKECRLRSLGPSRHHQERIETTMSLQLLRGRESRPPLRSGREKPNASTVLDVENTKQFPRMGKAQAAAKPKTRLRFPVGEETRAFYRRVYPGTTTAEWNDWHWQFQARVPLLPISRRSSCFRTMNAWPL